MYTHICYTNLSLSLSHVCPVRLILRLTGGDADAGCRQPSNPPELCMYTYIHIYIYIYRERERLYVISMLYYIL